MASSYFQEAVMGTLNFPSSFRKSFLLSQYLHSYVFLVSIDSLIRCWDSTSFQEKYCITAGLGGAGTGPELCIWSLLFLR
jgi:hypothetical protein